MIERIKLECPVSIVMPVSNEAPVIEQVVEEWVQEVIQYLPSGSELYFDEAASTDGTREILERLKKKYPFLRVDYHERKEGFGEAARNLYINSKCPLVFFTDSDGQYVPAEFWKLAPFAGKFDIVHGAKIGRQDHIFRKISSACFNHIARLLFDEYYSDINSAFRFVTRRVIENLVPRVKCMLTLINAELLLRAEMENYAIRQVRVIHRKRQYGVSRGLPPSRYLIECLRAYHGLHELKTEYRQ